MPDLPTLSHPDAAAVLGWYDRHRRIMPWRALPGQRPDPYHVWLSEIMLQQTTVAAVGPYFRRFLALFPDVRALAAAPEEAVLSAWAGLGYYARARNLHACAQQVAALGAFPDTVDGLRALPGIGAYTAAAVAAIAFGVPVVPVDGNVERVTARLFAVADPLPAARPRLGTLAATLNRDAQAQARPSDFAQALFDLGATICTPRNPACALCPWMTACAGRAQGIAATLPRKAAKPVRPERHGAVFRLHDAAGRVLLRRRPPQGLLGGMTELPGTAWREAPWTETEIFATAPLHANWRAAGTVRHVFTHFALTLTVQDAHVPEIPAEALAGHFLLAPDEVATAALPTLFRKCLTLD